jgi:hypothetical protein
MDYYEFHYLVKDLLEHLKKQNEAQSGEREQTNDMMGKMKMPNMKMPNIKVPKLG